LFFSHPTLESITTRHHDYRLHRVDKYVVSVEEYKWTHLLFQEKVVARNFLFLVLHTV